MVITVRILVHELEQRFGEVLTGSLNQRRQCSDVRILGDAPCESGFFYVADAASAKRLSAEGGSDAIVLAVDESAVPAKGQLALRRRVSHLEVFAYLQDVFSRYRSWLEEMDRTLIRNEGLQGLFDVSEGFLRNNTIIVDPALKLLAHTKNIPCDDPITVELLKHGYHTEENIRKFQLNRRFEPWATQNGFIINDTNEICKYTTAVFSFKAAGSFSLIVVMMCNNVDPEPWLLDTFMMFLVRVAYYSMRDYTDGSPSGSAFNAFVHDILDGALSDADEIEERRRYLGIPADGPFCLFSIDVSLNRPLSARIVTDVARSIAPAKAMLCGAEVVVLCFSCHGVDCPIGCPIDGCPSGGSNVFKRLAAVLEEYGLQAGRSVRFDKLAFLPTALEQARLALKTARALGQDGAAGDAGAADGADAGAGAGAAGCIFGFDELYFDHAVMTISRGHRELLTSLRGCRQLARIREYDRIHGTDNFVFLRQYLRYERRTTMVAEKLHMHRNNVKYRVDRLGELFGVDTDDDDERLELSIAYRLMDALDR